MSAGADLERFSGGPPPLGAEAATIGAELRSARQFKGLSLQDMADATRIRRSYLAALEEMKLDQLPSRPFTIGYVRAYAHALGMDPDGAVSRFKADAPVAAEPLRAPVGVSREGDPRLTLAGGAAAVVLSAVLVWNLAQHAVAEDKPPSAAVAEAGPLAPTAAAQGTVMLTAAQPAPQESDAPAAYITPGLTPSAAGAPGAVSNAPTMEAAAGAIAPMRVSFGPRAAIYGAAPDHSVVTLQARKTASLIVRGADGAVYFARQLAAGDSYRAPLLNGLTADVSDPAAFDVYARGQFKGALQSAQTPLAKLAG